MKRILTINEFKQIADQELDKDIDAIIEGKKSDEEKLTALKRQLREWDEEHETELAKKRKGSSQQKKERLRNRIAKLQKKIKHDSGVNENNVLNKIGTKVKKFLNEPVLPSGRFDNKLNALYYEVDDKICQTIKDLQFQKAVEAGSCFATKEDKSVLIRCSLNLKDKVEEMLKTNGFKYIPKYTDMSPARTQRLGNAYFEVTLQ